MIIDPEDEILEHSETDNTFEKVFLWSEDASDLLGHSGYKSEDIMSILNDLGDLMDSRDMVVGSGSGANHAGKVIELAEAGYYLLTGASFWDERLTISILDNDEYLEWLEGYFTEGLAVVSGSDRSKLIQNMEKTMSVAAGVTVSRFGKIAVAIDGERTISDVISTLAHELGHVRQLSLNPSQDDARYMSYYVRAVHEAEAQQFERAFWLQLEEFTGARFMKYPKYEIYIDFIDQLLDDWYDIGSEVGNGCLGADIGENIFENEHDLGFLIQWLAVLDDPNVPGSISTFFTDSDQLDSSSSMQLFDYLVHLNPVSMDAYVANLLQSLETNIGKIGDISIGRLSSEIHEDVEGSPYLRVQALLAP